MQTASRARRSVCPNLVKKHAYYRLDKAQYSSTRSNLGHMANLAWYSGQGDASSKKHVPECFTSQEMYLKACCLLETVLTRAAAETHPSWEHVTGQGIKRVGRRGPRTRRTLRCWFEKNYPAQVAELAESIRLAVTLKDGFDLRQ